MLEIMLATESWERKEAERQQKLRDRLRRTIRSPHRVPVMQPIEDDLHDMTDPYEVV